MDEIKFPKAQPLSSVQHEETGNIKAWRNIRKHWVGLRKKGMDDGIELRVTGWVKVVEQNSFQNVDSAAATLVWNGTPRSMSAVAEDGKTYKIRPDESSPEKTVTIQLGLP